MNKLTTLTTNCTRTIDRPTSSALIDPFRYILKLPPRAPEGFIAQKNSTLVETVIDAEGDGIGPISVSTACNHLFCYAVRYEHKNLGIMLIAGDCVQEALADGRIFEAIETLNNKSLFFGPIMFHSLTTVVTPQSARGFLASTVLHIGQTQLHSTIADIGSQTLSPPPPLTLLRVKLNGWLPFENSLPTCIFEGGTPNLMMHVAWDKNPLHSEHLRLA